MARVLIIDDELGVRKMMRRLLESSGHEVLEAEDAEAALHVMTTSPCDVACCDIQMPGRDGLWLTAELRRRYPHTAVVLVTGVTTVPPRMSLQAGVLAYLVKPFSQQALVQAVATAVQWVEDTRARGPRPEDLGQALDDWLDELKEL